MISLSDIKSAFSKSYKRAQKFDNSVDKINSMKSAAFVEQLGLMFQSKYPDLYVLSQTVEKYGRRKYPGEWLFDIVVCNKHNISEEGINKKYNYSLEWVVESEYKNTLEETLKDFSKLLVVKSRNLLYMNGYSSLDKKSFEKNIKKRLSTIERILSKADDFGNLYYCFWPSPEKKGDTSFWENDYERLENIFKLFKYSNESNSFEEIIS